MLTGIIMIVIGLGGIFVLLAFYWSLARSSTIGDRPLKDDCFAPYRRHLLTCRTCDPPGVLCEDGARLREWSIHQFLERRECAQKAENTARDEPY